MKHDIVVTCTRWAKKQKLHEGTMLTSLTRVNQSAWSLANFNAILLWTPLLTLTLSNLQHKVAPPGERLQLGFSFRWLLYGNFSIRYRAEPVWTGCLIKSTAAMYRKTGRYMPSAVCLKSRKFCACWTRKRQASVNGDVVSNVFCSRTADTSNDGMMSTQSNFLKSGSKKA